jgi:hypothetical protein
MSLGRHWLFWTTAFYLEAVAVDYNLGKPVMLELIQFAWIIIMSLPLWVPPLSRWLNVKYIWEV